jgi:hypothetical protein
MLKEKSRKITIRSNCKRKEKEKGGTLFHPKNSELLTEL